LPVFVSYWPVVLDFLTGVSKQPQNVGVSRSDCTFTAYYFTVRSLHDIRVRR